MSILRKNEKYLKSTMISVDSLELEINLSPRMINHPTADGLAGVTHWHWQKIRTLKVGLLIGTEIGHSCQPLISFCLSSYCLLTTAKNLPSNNTCRLVSVSILLL